MLTIHMIKVKQQYKIKQFSEFDTTGLLWLPYVIRQTIIFLPCGFYLLSSFFFSSPNLSGRRLDVYLTFTHGVTLVRI